MKLTEAHEMGKHNAKPYRRCPECIKDAEWADTIDIGMLPSDKENN